MLRSFDMLCATASANAVVAADSRQALLASPSGAYAMPWHWHDCMMLLLPRVGALDLCHQDRPEGAWISEDRFAVVPANHAHQTKALRDTQAHLAFYITDRALHRIEAQAGSLSRVKHRVRATAVFAATPEIATLRGLCRQRDADRPDIALRHISAALLASCFLEIEKADPLPAATSRGHGAALVREIQAFLTERAAQELSLDALADRFATSRRHLTRLFRDLTGQSIAEYHHDTRMALARRMLAGTDLPVGEIAFRVGFESGSALSRAMRRTEGRSPSDVRRAMARSVKN
ncbi:helix-turn-helix transcriptional regulator [Bradyrhizobium tropiciagri]|uniref:AraC family transcriptional regulator n=1 Tax=Bradyrhizobium tropiciagri TaxID=312253 RepID=UPI001BAB07A7|nr:AraC family transcriptional regulator [Bradyrhizobium tropiciagri]MBR0870323.1 helix-turn-helix transcriptional regulator [Bradyrhizobium tropiciagri]